MVLGRSCSIYPAESPDYLIAGIKLSLFGWECKLLLVMARTGFMKTTLKWDLKLSRIIAFSFLLSSTRMFYVGVGRVRVGMAPTIWDQPKVQRLE